MSHLAADAIADGRALAEDLMVDACSITRGPYSPGTFDPDTGEWTEPSATAVYTGRCQVQLSDGLTARELDAGQAEITTMRLTVKIPTTVVGVTLDDEITITASVHDPDLVGKRFRVIATHAKTFATSRRLQVEEIA